MNIDDVNTFLWVTGNLIVLLVFLSAIAFAVTYPILFNPNQTAGGRAIWKAIGSVAGIGLLVVVGLFIDGATSWTARPEHVELWRSILRLLVYGWVAYSFLDLVRVLIYRRFWPDKLKTAPSFRTGPVEVIDPNTLSVPPRTLRKRR